MKERREENEEASRGSTRAGVLEGELPMQVFLQVRAGVLEGRCPGLDGTELPFIGWRAYQIGAECGQCICCKNCSTNYHSSK